MLGEEGSEDGWDEKAHWLINIIGLLFMTIPVLSTASWY
jgi:hypothetical protein